MDRNYRVMCEVLDKAAEAHRRRRAYDFDDFRDIQQLDKVIGELERLKRDGLLDGAAEFINGMCLTCAVSGLTEEGEAFYRLIENDHVRAIIVGTLKEADIDVPYPLLKEVCEEIVKRYVTSFIPDSPRRQ